MQDILNEIIEYEEGKMDDEGIINLFSHLIKNGMAWTLQGSYERTAAWFIEQGLIDSKGNIDWDKHNEFQEMKL